MASSLPPWAMASRYGNHKARRSVVRGKSCAGTAVGVTHLIHDHLRGRVIEMCATRRIPATPF